MSAPSAPEAELLPDFVASESTAALLHASVRSALPSSYLSRLASEADDAGISIEEMAAQKISGAVRRLTRFWRSLVQAAYLRGLEPSELLTRMVLTGTMGPAREAVL